MHAVAVQTPLPRRSVAALWAQSAALLPSFSDSPVDLWEVSEASVDASAAAAAAAAAAARGETPNRTYSATYQVQKLLDDVCATPPDVRSVAHILAFVHGQNLTVADKGSRGENLLRVATQLIKQTPHTYGMAREAAVAEMRMRLVTRALRALSQAHRGVIIWSTVDELWTAMRHQRRLFRRRFARNAASEFKLYEAASLLASLPNTQTRWDRAGRKVTDIILLAAAIASTFLPFLALGPARNAVGNAATSFGNASGATGMVALDLAVDLVSRKPRPAPWHRVYGDLRGQFESFKLARKHSSPNADRLEASFARALAACHPDHKLLWRTWGFELPRNRRIFMLGVLDLTDRFIRRAQDLEHVTWLLPTVHRMLRSSKPTWHERAIEVLLTLDSNMPRLQALHPDPQRSPAYATCQQLLVQAREKHSYEESRQRWLSRAELGNVLQVEGHNGGMH